MSILGIIAAILTTSAFVPQAVKTIRTKKTEDLSLVTFLMIFIGTILWCIYGINLGDQPLIFANAITACLAGIIVSLKIRAMLSAKKES